MSVFTIVVMTMFLARFANATTINFETVPSETPFEGLVIDTQFQATYGVTFSLEGGGSPVLAQVGAPATAFTYISSSGADQPAPGQNVGSFFLTDDGSPSTASPLLIVTYDTPVNAASGVVIDIDEGTGGTIEAWDVQARDESGSIVDTISLSFGDPNTGDGIATTWSFDRSQDDIFSIRFAYVGTKPSYGIAFDNFSPSSPAVPVPPAIWLFGSSLLGLIGIARRRKVD